MNFVISLLTWHRNFSQSRGNPSTNHPLNYIYETDKLKIVIRRQWTSLLQFIKLLIASHEWIRSWQWSRQWLRDAKTILTSTDSSVLSSLEVGPVSKTSESSLPVAIGPWRHRRRVLGASTLYFQAKKTCTAMAALSPSPVWCAYPLPLFIPIFFSFFLSFFFLGLLSPSFMLLSRSPTLFYMLDEGLFTKKLGYFTEPPGGVIVIQAAQLLIINVFTTTYTNI